MATVYIKTIFLGKRAEALKKDLNRKIQLTLARFGGNGVSQHSVGLQKSLLPLMAHFSNCHNSKNISVQSLSCQPQLAKHLEKL